ncbi:hypothetical protein [Lactobacillus jensenii]|uniref:Uncharacterized protein n=1 Tax=Lactobacillus jensenii TaxID=109790 RepID=A0ABU9FJU5_LACJE|nr:hypothetical protein [Lactobacillus jensenii]DAR66698.1 MAG TPA: hypothetical protein [Caudoviricetes sp.]MCW8072193.1 hypothetical protein [Lactobacillus jensenii]MCW8090152.1 hypothetical protein [Lactobacillus jensenii]MDK8236061.1 hypothetical protein [Lactobacillus jensenii]MDT9544349.1 hypothetical protein [Lactobacillus jensenii]
MIRVFFENGYFILETEKRFLKIAKLENNKFIEEVLFDGLFYNYDYNNCDIDYICDSLECVIVDKFKIKDDKSLIDFYKCDLVRSIILELSSVLKS